MKAIGKCEVCDGKIIQAGNGNIFCEDCADKNFEEKLQAWADRKEKQRIIRRELANERYGLRVCVGRIINDKLKQDDSRRIF